MILTGMMLLPLVQDSRAYSDERISVYFYFTWMNEDGTWHEWRNISQEGYMKNQVLKIGQPVKCRIKVIPHVNCFFGFELSEIGSPNSFDLIEGTYRGTELGRGFKAVPYGTDIERLRENISRYGVPPKILFVGEPFEYNWVLKPNSNWSCDGCSGAPLNCDFDASFNMNPDDDVIIGVSFAVPLIRGEWTGPVYKPNQSDGSKKESDTNLDTKSTPGFEFLLLFISLICMFSINLGVKRYR
ncbi:MAG: hypothetical protein QXS02_06735 [Candidatus Thermoplasmatota archaeon]